MKKILVITVAALTLAACNKDNTVPVSDFSTELSASTDCGATKTHLEGTKVIWDANDAINVFSVGAQSEIVSSKFGTTETGETVVFKGDGIKLDENVHGFYPYIEGMTFSEGVFSVPELNTVKQKVSNSTFLPEKNIAAGKYEGNVLAFHNVGAYLKFTLTQEGADTVRKVEIRSNGGEAIAFNGACTVSYNGGNPVLSTVENSSDVIKIVPESGSFTTGETYYVWIMPGTYSSGISLTLYSKTLMVAEKKGVSSLNADRNEIVDLGSIGGLVFQAGTREKKTLEFDFTGAAQEGWPTADKWKTVETAPVPDSTVIYKMADETEYPFILGACRAATQARVAWTGTGVTIYAAQRFLGLPPVAGYRLFAVKCVQGTTPKTSRKGAITDRITETTSEPYGVISGGESVVWDTETVEYYLDETEVNTVYYLACTAGGIGSKKITLVYEKEN